MPPENFWWAYDRGITPCFFGFHGNYDFCILVQLVPHITVFSGQFFLDAWDSHDTLVRNRNTREPVTSVTIALLLGLAVIGTGTGISSLVLQNKHYNEL